MRRSPSAPLATLALLLLAAPVAAASDAKLIGTFDAWSAYADGQGKNKVCYMYAVPMKPDGKYTDRKPTYMQVADRPGEKAFNVVSVTAGYTYKPGSDVEVEIDGTKYGMFTHQLTAWARDSKTDNRLVDAMKAGNTMLVRGTSNRGTLTVDSYSLRGFTAAHAAMSKACGVR